jgi:hypothetical protein
MVFSYVNSAGQTYYLHAKEGVKNGVKMYYFAKAVNPHAKEDVLPEGREITEHPATKMPLLRKKA